MLTPLGVDFIFLRPALKLIILTDPHFISPPFTLHLPSLPAGSVGRHPLLMGRGMSPPALLLTEEMPSADSQAAAAI